MNFKRILLAVLCIAMYGCFRPDECDSSLFYPYWSEWTKGRLISIIDDSLAVLSADKYKIACKDNEEFLVSSRTGLSLVNYRIKQKPLSADTFSYNFEGVYFLFNPYFKIIGNYFKDSSVLVIDKPNKTFGFWKIGTSSIKFDKYSYSGTYSEYYDLNEASPWVDGNILFKNRTDTAWQVAVLNPKTGKIEQYDSFKGYEWLNECRDITSIENKRACVKFNRETESVELIVDGKITDTSSLYYGLPNIIFNGNYIIKRAYLSEVCKIGTKNFKFDNDFAPVWIDYYYNPPRFYKDNSKNSDDFVQYTYEDLFGW